MNSLQSFTGFTDLAILTDRRLEVIGSLRGLALIEIDPVPLGIGSTMKHVIPKHVASRPQFDVGHGIY